jgi:hypothetical protein
MGLVQKMKVQYAQQSGSGLKRVLSYWCIAAMTGVLVTGTCPASTSAQRMSAGDKPLRLMVEGSAAGDSLSVRAATAVATAIQRRLSVKQAIVFSDEEALLTGPIYPEWTHERHTQNDMRVFGQLMRADWVLDLHVEMRDGRLRITGVALRPGAVREQRQLPQMTGASLDEAVNRFANAIVSDGLAQLRAP